MVRGERFGRKNGKGFYDYAGRDKSAVAGARRHCAAEAGDSVRRGRAAGTGSSLVQALEAARCLEEGVVTDVREADVGSILGFGFAPFTGGTLSHIDGLGVERFVALLRGLAEKHGPRFRPPGAPGRHGEERRNVLRPLRARRQRSRQRNDGQTSSNQTARFRILTPEKDYIP